MIGFDACFVLVVEFLFQPFEVQSWECKGNAADVWGGGGFEG